MQDLNINYYQSESPFNDFAFISGTTLETCCLGKDFSSKHFNIANISVQFITNHALNKINDKIILSGYGIINKTWVNATSNLNNFKELDYYYSKGCFAGAIIKDNSISFFTDFFGNGKLFYYTKNKVTIVSNRLHLLLIILRLLNIDIAIDYNIVGIILTLSNHFLLQQPISSNLIYSDIKILEVYEKLDLTPLGIQISTSKYGEITNTAHKNIDSEPQEYRQSLQAAREEIITDLTTILNSGEYDHFVCDLTGGRDSRLILAAATNIPSFNKRLKIFSYGDELERRCVASIMHAYGLTYDSVFFRSIWWDKHTGVDTTLSGVREYFDTVNSFNLGTYWDTDSFLGRFCVTLEKTIRFNGGYGELLSRTADSYFNIKPSLQETLIDFCNQIEKRAIIKGFHTALYNLVYESITKPDIDNYYIRLKSFQTNHRLRYHFSNTGESGNTPTYSLAMSIEAYKTYCRYSNIGFPKIYFDLLYSLNPLVATFAYCKEDNNQMRLDNADRLLCSNPVYKKIITTANNDLTDFNNYYLKSRKWHFAKPNEVEEKISKNYNEWFNALSIEQILLNEINGLISCILNNVPDDFKKNVFLPFINYVYSLQAKERTCVSQYIGILRKLNPLAEAIKLNKADISDLHINKISKIAYKYTDLIQ